MRVLEILPAGLSQTETEKTKVESRIATACASEEEPQLGGLGFRVWEEQRVQVENHPHPCTLVLINSSFSL